MSDAARQKCTIYVGGLDQAVVPHTLLEAFIPFGEIVDVSLPKPDHARAPKNANGSTGAHPTESHRGFAYVEFELPVDAEEAIDNMNGSELLGRVIKVAAAKPGKDFNEGLGSRTALWEQVCYLFLLLLFCYTTWRLTIIVGGISGTTCHR